MSRAVFPAPRRQRGLSLIEVLVSVLVLAIGLLGIGAMQAYALRGGQSSLESSQAVMATNQIIEAMRLNRANAAAYNGTWAAPPAGGTLAQHDLNEWVAAMRGVANWQGYTPPQPALEANARGIIAGCPDACTVTIEWDDQRAGGGTRQLLTEAQL